jgi:hypothetical protein
VVVNDVEGAGFKVPYSSAVATISGTTSEFTLTFVAPWLNLVQFLS